MEVSNDDSESLRKKKQDSTANAAADHQADKRSDKKSNKNGGGEGSDDEVISDELDKFVRAGRTGRRNAIPNVTLDPNLTISASSISELMIKITCNDDGQNDETLK